VKENQTIESAHLTGESESGSLSRRAFLGRLALLAGGSAVAMACGMDPTATSTAQRANPTVNPTAPATSAGAGEQAMIEDGPVEFEAGGNTLFGYLSRPTRPGPHPGVVVVHENRGLLPHFPDVTRRLAREGYVALAVDMLSRKGGTDSFPDSGAMRDALRQIPSDQIVADGNSAVTYLQDQPFVISNRVGIMGFCFGGGIVWRMAVGNPEIRAAVPFSRWKRSSPGRCARLAGSRAGNLRRRGFPDQRGSA
jgi:carboxymethylenebutenolidase